MTGIVPVTQYRDMAFVASLLGTNKRWVMLRVKAGEFKAFQSDGKIHVNMDSVRDYIEQRDVRQLEVAEPRKNRMQTILT